MKAIVDDKIPYIKGQIERLVDEVLYLPGARISTCDVRDADILVVRTRTHCNRQLLEGSRVQLIVTATIGFDHLDTQYLAEAGIEWHNCPGCNATSVAQYVHNCLLLLEREKGICLKEATLGIIGVGHVGSQVLRTCRPLVGRVLLNDPPRENEELRMKNEKLRMKNEKFSIQHSAFSIQPEVFSSLSTLLSECDIITIHTPLVRDGEWPTLHLMSDDVMHRLGKTPVLINSGRGEVVDNEALLRALEDGRVREAIIDTWENEPDISRALLNKVYIGTPHIAGYSADGKANGTRMSLDYIAHWLAGRGDRQALTILAGIHVCPPSVSPSLVPSDDPALRALQLYDPRRDSERLKVAPSGFEKQRGDYPLRREQFD